MSGIVLLEDPKDVSARVTVFKALVYVGSPGLQDIQGSLRYFKEANDDLDYPEGLYQVTFSAAMRKESFEVYTKDEEEKAQYHFVGDIKKICLLQARDMDDPNGAWTINPCQQLTVFVCCAVLTDDQTKAIFTALPEQYTSAFADAKRAAESDGTVVEKSTFPFLAYIPDSHRFQSVKKPTPFKDRYSGFMGYLTGMSSALEGEKMVDRFRIEVDTVAFMGNCPEARASKSKSTPGPSSSQGHNPANKTPRWSYNNKTAASTLKRRREDNNGAAEMSSSPSVRD